MSLTSFLKSKDVRDRFRTEFLMPPLGDTKELLAPPLSENHSLVGMAFDYLLRFYIRRLNPKANTGPWVAEEAVSLYAEPSCRCPVMFYHILSKAHTEHDHYLKSGTINNRLLHSALGLAQMEVLYRSADDSYLDKVGIIDRKDIQDLRRLISLVNPRAFRAKRACALNSTFGDASELVGGADCDVIIDDALIEIKTTKEFKVKREYFDQLIGYYLLSRIGGISRLPKGHSIKRLGIYFSRHGHLWLFDVSTVIKEKQLPGFIRWFRKMAKQSF